MNILKKLSPEWCLRIGFAAMYLYSGVDIFRNPSGWIWAVPTWFIGFVSNIMPIEVYLKLQAIAEIIFALVFLAWFLNTRIVSYIALAAALEMAGILFLGKAGIDSITFRDLGLLGGLVALWIILRKRAQFDQSSDIE
ncbi:MAG: hypothetical protein AAB602_00095 [Patescibacteria group bacterium]